VILLFLLSWGHHSPEPVATEASVPEPEPPVDVFAAVYGERVTFTARYRVDPRPRGKRLQAVTLHRADGEVFIRSYRSLRDEYQFLDRFVTVTGRPYEPSPYVQAVMAKHFEVEAIELAPGEPAWDPVPSQLLAPELVRSADHARAQAGWFAECIGVIDGANFRFADGSSLPLVGEADAAEGTVTMLARVDEDGSLRPDVVCAGEDPRCGVVDSNARD
jgi:hypothetical protein